MRGISGAASRGSGQGRTPRLKGSEMLDAKQTGRVVVITIWTPQILTAVHHEHRVRDPMNRVRLEKIEDSMELRHTWFLRERKWVAFQGRVTRRLLP